MPASRASPACDTPRSRRRDEIRNPIGARISVPPPSKRVHNVDRVLEQEFTEFLCSYNALLYSFSTLANIWHSVRRCRQSIGSPAEKRRTMMTTNKGLNRRTVLRGGM